MGSVIERIRLNIVDQLQGFVCAKDVGNVGDLVDLIIEDKNLSSELSSLRVQIVFEGIVDFFVIGLVKEIFLERHSI